jgi:hypothetical protein
MTPHVHELVHNPQSIIPYRPQRPLQWWVEAVIPPTSSDLGVGLFHLLIDALSCRCTVPRAVFEGQSQVYLNLDLKECVGDMEPWKTGETLDCSTQLINVRRESNLDSHQTNRLHRNHQIFPFSRLERKIQFPK